MKKIPLIIDCDPGIDDAVALMMLSKAKNIDIKLLTSVYGNKSVKDTTKALLHLCEKFNINAPVCKGLENPLYIPRLVINAHGNTGLGDYVIPKTNKELDQRPYWEAMCDVLRREKKVTILCLGPLTNITYFMQKYPDYKKYIKEVVFMAGSKDKLMGLTAYAEFNIKADPDAMIGLLNSGVKCTCVPMELGHNACLTEEDIKRVKQTNKLGKDFAKMFSGYRDGHVPFGQAAMHDGCAATYLIKHNLLEIDPVYLDVRYDDEVKSNCLVADFDIKPEKRFKICTDINIDKFKQLFFTFLKKYK